MLLKALVLLAVAWLVIVGLAWVFQRSLIYLPITGAAPSVKGFFPTGEDVALETEDGLHLGGWFVPPRGGAAGAAVIVFNGNAGDRSLRAPLALVFREAGLSVLLLDYRGYGGNPGHPSEKGLLADARAARRWLAGRDGVDPDRIVYFGESLGSAVAVGLAREHPPAAMILRSPFPSLADVGRAHYPILPVRTLLKDRFEAAVWIREVRTPVLVIAGQADRIVPARLSRRLYDLAPEPKRFALIAGAGHNDAALFDGAELVAEALRFLTEAKVLDDGREGTAP